MKPFAFAIGGKPVRPTSVACLVALLVFAAEASAQLPDLIVNRSKLVSSIELQTRNFPASDCAVVEGCIRSGTRKVLLFEVSFANIGQGDLVIGNPADHPDLYHHSPCHNHSHFEGAASYDLLSSDGRAIITARKQAFCFRDNEPYLRNAGPSRGYDCDYQGISAGWQDIYYKGLDCQWLDVTGLPGGVYTLRITVNPERRFEEANYGNNVATVTVQIPGTPSPAPSTSPPPPSVTPQPRYTPPPKKVKTVKKAKKGKGRLKEAKGSGRGRHGHHRGNDRHDDDDDD
jgi:hypothetical protein